MIILTIILLLFLILMLPLLILASIAFDYAVCSYALYRVAKRTDACKPSRAWIPVLRYEVMGKCAEALDAQTGKGGKKPWKWGKILLIMRVVHLGAIIFILPIGFLLALFGAGILLKAVSWLSIALTVAISVCAYKMFHYYLEDPYDVILLALTVLYPGWLFVALLIVSWFKPQNDRTPEQQSVQQDAESQDDACEENAAVIPAEPDEG